MYILNVANKRLPDHDYRIRYRMLSRFAKVIYALPGCPQSLTSHEFVPMEFREGITLHDARCFVRLFRHLTKHRKKYDVVHFFSTKLQLFGPICAALAGVPCVNTITGFGRTYNRDELRYRLLRPLYFVLMRISLGLSKAAFFQNHGDMQWLAHKLPSLSHKMHWVGSGVGAEIIQEKDFHQLPLVVLMVGRLMKDKGISTFLEAAERLHGGPFRFLLAGPPSVGQDSLYHQVFQAHEQGTIEYVGELEQDELRKLYRRSHVFAFPSRGEGMPRVMLEAGHALLCPFASDIPAHRDLIRANGGILLAPNQEAESLISHLQRLESNRGELESNARAYQRHIVKNYNMEAYAKRMDDLLWRFIASPVVSDRCPQQRAA